MLFNFEGPYTDIAVDFNKKVSVVMMNDQINPTPVDAVWDGSRLTLIKNSNGSAAFYVTFK